MKKNLYINPNPHTVYVRDADGLEVPVEPWRNRDLLSNPDMVLIVEGPYWDSFSKRGQLEAFDGNVEGRPVRSEKLPAEEVPESKWGKPVEETPVEDSAPSVTEEPPVEDSAPSVTEEPPVEDSAPEEPVEVEEEEEVEAAEGGEEEEKKPVVDYTQFKKKELQRMCDERDLPTSGNRDDLITRLVNDDNGFYD